MGAMKGRPSGGATMSGTTEGAVTAGGYETVAMKTTTMTTTAGGGRYGQYNGGCNASEDLVLADVIDDVVAGLADGARHVDEALCRPNI